PALADSPFRLLQRAEPWDAVAPRRAGVSAFGFGGNNAHVLVEEWRGERPGRVAVSVSEAGPPRGRLAVVGLGIVAADACGAEAFEHALFEGVSRVRARPEGRASAFTPALELDAAAVRFPPRDLQQALPQQLLLLRAAQEAVAQAGALPRERTSVIVGMQCDAEVARYGARWRVAEWLSGEDASTVQAARDAIQPPLTAAGVVGTMPNICANRLNSQFDALSASLTVSAEEASGLVALELGARALRAGEIDAAIVGAVDVCANEVHERAAEGVLPQHVASGDAAVVLVLRRLEDARRDRQPVLGVVLDEGLPAPESDVDVESVFGHAHAAAGLLRLAAGLLRERRRAEPLQPTRVRVS